MYCHICGNKLDDEDIYCCNCGVKVKRVAKPAEKPKEEPAENAQVNIQTNDVPVESVTENNIASENCVQKELIPSELIPSELVPAEDVSAEVVPAEVAPAEVAPAEAAGSTEAEKTDDTVSLETVEEKEAVTPQENAAFEFKPQEFTENDFTQSSIFQPIPDIVIADAAEKTEKHKNSPSVMQAVCSVLLSLFVFVLATVLTLQLFIRFGFTEERLQGAFNNVNYKEIKASSILDIKAISEKYGKEIPEDATLAEAIYKMIDQRELVNPISQSEVERLIERLNFQDFIAEKSSKAVSILRSGSDEQPVYADEIIAFLKDNEEEIEKTIGIQLLDVDYEYMQKYLEDHNDELLDVLSEKNITGTENSFGYTLIRFFCSDWFIAVLCAMIVVIAVAVGFINKKFYSSMLYSGVPIATAGILLLACSVFYEGLLSNVSNYFPTDFIKQFAAPVIRVLTVVSAIAAAVGILMLIIGILLKAKEKRKRKQVSDM